MQQFDRFEATFSPVRADDLQPGAAEWIGRRLRVMAAWVIETGQFEGQWAMSVERPPFGNAEMPDFVWVPECDLSDMVSLNNVWTDNTAYDFPQMTGEPIYHSGGFCPPVTLPIPGAPAGYTFTPKTHA